MKWTVFVLCLIALLCSGCINLSRSEKENLRVIRDAGLSPIEVRVKSVPAAGWLNVLPGVGNFYLAIGTDETEQYLVGFMNLLFWPLSCAWGIPQAAIDANTLNKRETLYYYMSTERGRAELQEAIDRTESMPPIRRRP